MSKYFDIHMIVHGDSKPGYSVFIKMPDNANENEAVEEMTNQHLYEEPEDLNNIDYIDTVSEADYKAAKGIHDTYKFEMPIYAGITNMVKGELDIKSEILNQLQQGDPIGESLMDEIETMADFQDINIDTDRIEYNSIMPYITPDIDSLILDVNETHECDDVNVVALDVTSEFNVLQFITDNYAN